MTSQRLPRLLFPIALFPGLTTKLRQDERALLVLKRTLSIRNEPDPSQTVCWWYGLIENVPSSLRPRLQTNEVDGRGG